MTPPPPPSGRTRLALVAGIAVLASVATPLAAASGVVTPVVRVGAEVFAPVTVVQDGGFADVVLGSDVPPSKIRFTATLPAGFTGEVRAQLSANDLPSAGWTAYDVAKAFKDTSCSLNGGTPASCTFFAGRTEDDDDTVYLDLPTATAVPGADGRTVVWEVQTRAVGNLHDFMRGTVNLTDAAGTALASGPFRVNFVDAVAPWRPTVYGRDAAGALWQYESDGKPGSAAYKPRTKVGGGWNVYDTITRLGGTYVGDEPSNSDNDLVARDAAGQLWYYQGTGNASRPFQSRKLVGGGWGQYTSIVGMGYARGRAHNLLARGADGVLWFYKGTGNPDRPFERRLRVGGGWNQYTSLTAFPNGIVAKDAAGVLWIYDSNWNGDAAVPLKPRRKLGTGFGPFTALGFAGDKDARGGKDLLARDRNGNLWMYPGDWAGADVLRGKRVLVGGGWNIYNALI